MKHPAQYLAVCMLLVVQLSSAQWYQQNSGTTHNLYRVQFVDASTGWAVGDSGLILHTSNGGSNWIQQTTGIQLPITDVVFTDASTGWVLGREGDWWGGRREIEHNILLKTTNGGATWIQQINDTTCFLDAICFINQSTGWITGRRDINPDSAEIVLMKTTDGGNGWFTQSFPLTDDPGTSHLAICFIDSLAGYVITGNCGIGGWGFIYKTTDGGDTWNEQLFPRSWRDIAFSDTQNGIVVGFGRSERVYWGLIYQTTDGGGEWQQVFEGGIFNLFEDVYVSSSNVITVVGSSSSFGKILRSEDAGTSWMIQDSISNPLNGVSFIDDYVGWAVGYNGTILHTTNGGVTFVEGDSPGEIPTGFSLHQNYPNPFNPTTVISYHIPVVSNQSSVVSVKIFDLLGREVAVLVNEEKLPGSYSVTWSADEMASGIYYCRMRAGEFVQTRKLVLLR